LRPVGGFVIHLVDSNNHLLHTECVGKECVLTSLSVLGNTGLELTSG
jgi:hypothetical protein